MPRTKESRIDLAIEDLLQEYGDAAEYAHDNAHGWKEVPFWDCPLRPCCDFHAAEKWVEQLGASSRGRA